MVTLIDNSEGTFPSSFPAPKTSFQQSVVPIQDIQAICSCRTAAIRDGVGFEHDQQPPGGYCHGAFRPGNPILRIDHRVIMDLMTSRDKRQAVR